MRLRSLRARLLAGVIAVAAVCVIALGAIVYAQQRDFLLERVDEQAVSAAPLVGRVLDAEGVPRPRGDVRPHHGGPGGGGVAGGPAGAALSLSPGIYAERRDVDGTRLGAVVLTYGDVPPSPPRLPAEVPAGEVITVPSRDGSLEYRVHADVSPGGGATIVAIALSGVEEQLDELLGHGAHGFMMPGPGAPVSCADALPSAT